jgi:hypothetical protein
MAKGGGQVTTVEAIRLARIVIERAQALVDAIGPDNEGAIDYVDQGEGELNPEVISLLDDLRYALRPFTFNEVTL